MPVNWGEPSYKKPSIHLRFTLNPNFFISLPVTPILNLCSGVLKAGIIGSSESLEFNLFQE